MAQKLGQEAYKAEQEKQKEQQAGNASESEPQSHDGEFEEKDEKE